ncbi:hypothetical protein EalM132_00072 [Exiguobacterium phage vB_EalM-132]|nr:hypothetical protein EalM132_00072 [Exiguobacterium phage vB_EalM-132]
MITLAEDYIQDLLNERFQYLRNNPMAVDKILDMPTSKKAKLKAYLASEPASRLKIIKGYPRTPNVLPCICLLMAGEDESQSGLGDHSELGDDTDLAEDTISLPIQIDRDGTNIIRYLKVPKVPLEGIVSITNVQTGGELYPLDEYSILNPNKGIIAIESDSYIEGDILEVVYQYGVHYSESLETLYETNYRLEVWTSSGDLTVEIYHLLKWAILSVRGKLVEQVGLFRQKLGGSDFEPVPNYFPEFVYRRAMTLWCQSIVGVSDMEEIEVVTDIIVNNPTLRTSREVTGYGDN